MARYICKVLQISFIKLAKPKPIKGFDGRPAKPITHAIYPTLPVQGHTKMLASLLVTQLGQHPIILGKPWMRRHGVILDMSCDKLAFWPGHCEHSGIKRKTLTAEKKVGGIALAPSLSEPMRGQEKALVQESARIMLDSSPKENLKKISADRVALRTNSGVCGPKEGVTPGRKILKREADINVTKNKATPTRNSAELLLHVLSNARGYRCVSKEAEEPLPRYVIPQKRSRASSSVLSLASSLALSGASQLEEEPLQLAMIDAALFQYLAKQKGVEIFAISMQDVNYQLDKDKRPPTNPATRVPECYHDFLDVFSKEAFNTVSAHSKHNHVIRLLSEKDHGQAVLRPNTTDYQDPSPIKPW